MERRHADELDGSMGTGVVSGRAGHAMGDSRSEAGEDVGYYEQ